MKGMQQFWKGGCTQGFRHADAQMSLQLLCFLQCKLGFFTFIEDAACIVIKYSSLLRKRTRLAETVKQTGVQLFLQLLNLNGDRSLCIAQCSRSL